MRRKFDHQKPITADFSIVLKAAVRKFSFPSSKGQKIFKSNAENLLNQQEKRGKNDQEAIENDRRYLPVKFAKTLFFFGMTITGLRKARATVKAHCAGLRLILIQGATIMVALFKTSFLLPKCLVVGLFGAPAETAATAFALQPTCSFKLAIAGQLHRVAEILTRCQVFSCLYSRRLGRFQLHLKSIAPRQENDLLFLSPRDFG